MTLAVILSICALCSGPVSFGEGEAWIQAAGDQASPTQSSTAQAQSNTGNAQVPAPASEPQAAASPQSASPPPPAPAQTPSGKKSNTSKHRPRKRAAPASTTADCTKPTPAATGASERKSTAGQNGVAADKTQPANCPPPITVIHNGSTTEPSIQLVGGTGSEQAASHRSTTDQLVGSTEENLKKVAGRQLDANQQEVLKQIQQFLDQSKAAVAAGDFERGHNLAMKAHLLSDELAKP